MRYFFDVLDRNGCLRDDEGASFGSLEQMRAAARRTLAQMAQDEIADDVSLGLRVRDEAGAEVYNICLDIKAQARPH